MLGGLLRSSAQCFDAYKFPGAVLKYDFKAYFLPIFNALANYTARLNRQIAVQRRKLEIECVNEP